MTALGRQGREARRALLFIGGEERRIVIKIFEADGASGEVREIHRECAEPLALLTTTVGGSKWRYLFDAAKDAKGDLSTAVTDDSQTKLLQASNLWFP